jgi:hypothetical protein
VGDPPNKSEGFDTTILPLLALRAGIGTGPEFGFVDVNGQPLWSSLKS